MSKDILNDSPKLKQTAGIYNQLREVVKKSAESGATGPQLCAASLMLLQTVNDTAPDGTNDNPLFGALNAISEDVLHVLTHFIEGSKCENESRNVHVAAIRVDENGKISVTDGNDKPIFQESEVKPPEPQTVAEAVATADSTKPVFTPKLQASNDLCKGLAAVINADTLNGKVGKLHSVVKLLYSVLKSITESDPITPPLEVILLKEMCARFGKELQQRLKNQDAN